MALANSQHIKFRRRCTPLIREEGSSGTDTHGQTPYLCIDISCSSQENLATKPTELELAAVGDLIDRT